MHLIRSFVVVTSICAALGLWAATLRPQAPLSTEPKTLVFVYRVPDGGQLRFSASGPQVSDVVSARVLRNTAAQSTFKTLAKFDSLSKAVHVSIEATVRPISGPHSVQLLNKAGQVKGTAPLTIRIANAPIGSEDPLSPRPQLDNRQGGVRIQDRPDVILGRKKIILRPPAGVVPNGPPRIDSFYPSPAGPAKGTLVLEGANLNGIRGLYFGQTQLQAILKGNAMSVYKLPDLPSSQTADLIIDGPATGDADKRVIAEGYRIATASDLPVEAILTLDAAVGNLPHAKKSHSIRFKNVPGEFVTSIPQRIDITSVLMKDISFSGNVRPVVDGVRVFGSEFVLTFNGKSRNVPDFMRVFFERVGCRLTASSPIIQTTSFSDSVDLPPALPNQDYPVENTKDLNDSFQWLKSSSWGTTEGTSSMLGGRSIDVGKLTIGNDVAFRIASGPVGTNVVWQSAPLMMNEGWYVKELRWSVQHGHPSDQQPKAKVQLHSVNPQFSRAPDQFLHADNNEVWPTTGVENKNGALMMNFFESVTVGGRTFIDVGKDPFQWFFRPIKLQLNAESTLVNDHDVTLRLEKVVFRGPTGKRWQDAIRGLVVNNPSGINFLVGGAFESTLSVFQPTD